MRLGGRRVEGLSPLARGNQSSNVGTLHQCGPIPARAGQPLRRAAPGFRAGAYPRSRGATAIQVTFATVCWGLSPLARGNRDDGCGVQLADGPIPARAGQPSSHAARCILIRAYPRSRGATLFAPVGLEVPAGLSPLARGNRRLHIVRSSGVGPIPARAGQPWWWPGGTHQRWVYPRSRGATGAHVAARR